jgi:hypothetical protein
MDVSTRWDSTCAMLVRAMRLREAITKYCNEHYQAKAFSLTNIEWMQIGYLIDILRPFNFFTTTVGKTKGITLPYGLGIFDELYERLTESRRRLSSKIARYSWIDILIKGIDAAETKLDQYYNKMYSDVGSIYAMGAILNPLSKLEAFNPDFCWLNFQERQWRYEYEEQFRKLYSDNYRRGTTIGQHLRALREVNKDPLALMLDRSRYSRMELSSDQIDKVDNEEEVDQWLATSKYLLLY